MAHECGECSVCCYVGAVPEIEKPAHVACKHIKTSACGSCSIFKESYLPKTCSSFMCAWRHGFGNDGDRPDKIGVMFAINRIENSSGNFLVAIETEPNALLTKGKSLAVTLIKAIQIPMIVSKYGSKPPNDTGDFVIVLDSMLPRCKLLAGSLVERISEDVAMYTLIKHTPTLTYKSSNGSSNSSI